MTIVERLGGDFVVEARLLADAFGLPQEKITARMRDGAITSRCEAGVEEDAGRWRLTFHYGNRACRFVIDESGVVLETAVFPIRSRPRGVAEKSRSTRTVACGPEGDR